MSEYMEKFSVSRLIGAPPGYVGYEEGGQLTEAVRRRPYQVILLDEIEKAHPDVFNVLLQVLDDGRLTDGQGRTVDFRNTRRDHDQQRRQPADLGGLAAATRTDAAYEAMKRQVTDALRAQFRPEFLNRIDEIIVFHALTEEDLARIVDLLLADLERAARRAATSRSTLTPAARALIVREGTDPAFGARPLKRTIQRLVENPLARALLQRRVQPGDTITADADPVSGTLVFSSERSTVVAEAGRPARRPIGPDRRAGAGDRGRAGRRGRGGRSRSTCRDVDEPPSATATASSSTDRATCAFGGVVARLEALPRRLPEPPAALMPVRVGDVRGPARGPARSPTPGRPRCSSSSFPRRPARRRSSSSSGRPAAATTPARSASPAAAPRTPTTTSSRPRSARPRRRSASTPPRRSVRVAGTIEPFWIPVSNYRVTPVVAIAGRPPALSASPDEVAAIVEAPFSLFLPPRPSRSSSGISASWRIRYGGYRIGGLHVWGATARILGQLGAFLA